MFVSDFAFFDGVIYAIGGLTYGGTGYVLFKWDTTTSSWVGIPMTDLSVSRTLLVWDDGNGDALYVGGDPSSGNGLKSVQRTLDGSSFEILAFPNVGASSSYSVNKLEVWGDVATDSLTLTGQPLDTETVTIDGKVYTFQAVLTDVDGNVHIGAAAADSLDNLDRAIRGGTGAGTDFADSMVTHPTVTSVRTALVLKANARRAGEEFNFVVTAETLTNGAWTAGVMQGGRDEQLYAGGLFDSRSPLKGIARWDAPSANWVIVGLGLGDAFGQAVVNGLAAYDDGTGWHLFACGLFDRANGTATVVQNVAKFNGNDWENPGGGISVGGGGFVFAMVAHDDGDRIRLYCGGVNFATNRNLLAWDGSAWAPVGDHLEQILSSGVVEIRALLSHGSRLAIGGHFHQRGSTEGWGLLGRIAKHDLGPDSWEALAAGFDGAVFATAVVDGVLYAGGTFSRSGAIMVPWVAQWGGAAWSQVGNGQINGAVYAIAERVSGEVWFAGAFTIVGDDIPALRAAKVVGGAWASVGNFNAPVRAMVVTGGNVYLGGEFDVAGGAAGNLGLVEWDGSTWNTICDRLETTSGFPRILSLAISGGFLYVGGEFDRIGNSTGSIYTNNVARMNLTTKVWSAMASGVDGEVRSLAASGGFIYVGGAFQNILPSTVSPWIARWSSGGGWVAASLFNAATFHAPVNALIDVGGDVHAATMTSGASYNRHSVQRYDNPNWSTLGGSDGDFSDEILSLGHGSIGGSSDVYAGGKFVGGGDQSDAMTIPESLIVFWTRDGFKNAAGGVGNQAQDTPILNPSGTVHALRRFRLLGDACYRMFIGGTFVAASRDYCWGIAGLLERRWVRLQGGLYGGEGSRQAMGAVRRANGDLAVVGEFHTAMNRLIRLADLGTQSRLVTALGNAAKWVENQYWQALGGGIGGAGGLDVVEYGGDLIAFGENIPPMIFDDTAETWAALDPVFPASGSDFYSAVEIGGTLFIACEAFIAAAFRQVITWDGAVYADISPDPVNFTQGRKVIEYQGDLYACGQDFANGCVRKRSGGAWSYLGGAGAITGECRGIAWLDFDGGSRLMAVGDLTIGGTQYWAAVWNGSAWTGLAQLVGPNEQVHDVVAIQGVGVRKRFLIVGEIGLFTDPASVEDDVETVGCAEWDLATGWLVPTPQGGFNSGAVAAMLP